MPHLTLSDQKPIAVFDVLNALNIFWTFVLFRRFYKKFSIFGLGIQIFALLFIVSRWLDDQNGIRTNNAAYGLEWMVELAFNGISVGIWLVFGESSLKNRVKTSQKVYYWLGKVIRGLAILMFVAILVESLFQLSQNSTPQPGKLYSISIDYRSNSGEPIFESDSIVSSLWSDLGVREEINQVKISRKMHLNCSNYYMEHPFEGTIVLDAGMPFFSTVWIPLFGLLNSREKGGTFPHEVQFCSYDRLGYGWSELGLEPRDLESHYVEMRELLRVSNTKGPFVYAGWSYGTTLAQVFYHLDADNLKGMVLMDPMSTTQLQNQFVDYLQSGISSFNSLRMIYPFGLGRLLSDNLPLEAGFPDERVTEPMKSSTLANCKKFNFPETAYRELLGLEDGLEHLRVLEDNSTNKTQVPTVLLASSVFESEGGMELNWKRISEKIGGWKKVLVVEKSDHYLPLFNVNHVLNSITVLLERINR
eukprot:TRINITY_DN4653_c0_g1_i1.p1 TRINITY_DN4653_c0_g1~~TRINITY_DN4653_c0_g1_i1.p1  ORF type:complete len:475 (+),score=106.05 TRINITY_DN4653_c0_g1_i1:32-1456(+)